MEVQAGNLNNNTEAASRELHVAGVLYLWRTSMSRIGFTYLK